MPSPSLLTGPLRIGDLLDRAIHFYRHYFRLLIVAPVLFLTPLAIVNAILQAMAQPYSLLRISTLSDTPSAIFRLLNAGGASSRGILIIAYIQIILSSFVTLTVASQCINLLHGNPSNAKPNIVQGVRYLWSYLRFLFVVGLALIGLGIAMLIPLSIIFAMARLPIRALVPLAVALIVAAFLLLYIRWEATLAAMVAEDLGPLQAMRRSWQLTHGLFWRTFIFFVISLLLGYVLIISPIIMINLLAAIFAPDRAVNLLGSIKSIMQGGMSILVLPLSTAIRMLYYYDLRARQEGYDISLQVQQMENQVIV